MRTYVIYARKSSESEDRQILSIDSQTKELKLLALRRGLEVSETLTEAHSAKAPGRPVFGDLMRRINRGQVAGVLCWKMDRLARNHLDHGQVLQALADHKLQEVITTDRAYTADGNDRFLGNFELGMATKYIDDLRQNVARGNRARFQRGWPNYRPPAGYLEDHVTKTIVKDPDRFDLIRRAWDLALAGSMRPNQVLKVLNDQWGFRSRKTKAQGGRPMSPTGFYDLLSNPFYMGIIRLRSGETYQGKHEPMLTPEEFARVQELLGRTRRPRPSRHRFTYAGILTCAICGRTMVGEEHVKPSGKRYVYYRCHRRGSDGHCAEPTMPETVFEAQLREDLQRMALPKESTEWIRDCLGKSLEGEVGQLSTARESKQKALTAAETEGETLLSLRLRGQVDDPTFERRRGEIMERQATLRIELNRPFLTKEELLKRIDSALAFSQRAPIVFKDGTPVQRRQIVETVCSNPRVKARKALYTAKKPFSLFASTAASSQWWATADQVRTWVLNSEGFWLPDLDAPQPDIVPPLAAASGKGG